MLGLGVFIMKIFWFMNIKLFLSLFQYQVQDSITPFYKFYTNQF